MPRRTITENTTKGAGPQEGECESFNGIVECADAAALLAVEIRET